MTQRRKRKDIQFRLYRHYDCLTRRSSGFSHRNLNAELVWGKSVLDTFGIDSFLVVVGDIVTEVHKKRDFNAK